MKSRIVLILTFVCIGYSTLSQATEWPVTRAVHFMVPEGAKEKKTRYRPVQKLLRGICKPKPHPVPVETKKPTIELPKDDLEARVKAVEDALAQLYKAVPPYVSRRLNDERRVVYHELQKWRAAAKRDLDIWRNDVMGDIEDLRDEVKERFQRLKVRVTVPEKGKPQVSVREE